MADWTILTCEYPPESGGVGDYTAQVAAGLAAAGDRVTVVCPPARSRPSREAAQTSVDVAGVTVVVLDDHYGPLGRRTLDERLNGQMSTVLVEYVPTGFGMHGANIPWCRWLLDRARRYGNDVHVMFHEPYFEFTWNPIQQNVLAVAERIMAKLLLRAASHVYVSTDAWRRYLEPHMPAARPMELVTLPIPSTIPRCDRATAAGKRRGELLGDTANQLVGHFGTFGDGIAPMVEATIKQVLTRASHISAVFAGMGSEEFVRAMERSVPAMRGRVHGTGRVSAPEAAIVLSACDLLVQPYPDGVTTRRTSIMAGLINGRAVMTTTGHLTERVWAETGAVALAPASDIQTLVTSTLDLLSNAGDRAALAARGENTYRERFALDHTIRALRRTVEGAAA